MSKIKLNGYYKPTPKKWRKFGDALIGISISLASYSIYQDYKGIAIFTMVCGTVGKFLTNFFAEDE